MNIYDVFFFFAFDSFIFYLVIEFYLFSIKSLDCVCVFFL
jgi:hypothetical protein